VPAAATNGRARDLQEPKYKSSHPLNGAPLTRDESKASYAIIRHNIRTYESGGVVLVVKGRENAEMRVKHFETGQSSEDRHAGWRYFVEKSDLKAGMDPAEATNLRQMKLEIRESEAQPDQMPVANPPRQN
jgi:Cu2+-containing amine oxidase